MVELVDTADSKSVVSDDVRVRVPLVAPYLGVAQLVERVLWEHEAEGSSPSTQTTERYKYGL